MIISKVLEKSVNTISLLFIVSSISFFILKNKIVVGLFFRYPGWYLWHISLFSVICDRITFSWMTFERIEKIDMGRQSADDSVSLVFCMGYSLAPFYLFLKILVSKFECFLYLLKVMRFNQYRVWLRIIECCRIQWSKRYVCFLLFLVVPRCLFGQT